MAVLSRNPAPTGFFPESAPWLSRRETPGRHNVERFPELTPRPPGATTSQPYFTYANGWRTDLYPREVVDVNGEGHADAVGFGYSRLLIESL